MPSTEIATTPTGALALKADQVEWTDRQRAALVQLGVEKAPDGDLAVFLHQCQRTGLDPFLKQIYMIGRWDKTKKCTVYTIQTGIDGFRLVAERRQGQYGGSEEPEWCAQDGVWRTVWPSSAPPVAARVGVHRLDWGRIVYATVHFNEFAGKTGEGNLNSMWRTKPAHMLAKCAEALALRKCFPQDLSGVYLPEEMPDEPLTVPSERADAPAANADPEQEEIDWEARIADAAGDIEALRRLYDEAKGIYGNSNPELAERLAAAGKAAKEAGEAASAAEGTQEALDAEVVDEPPADREPLGTDPADSKQLQLIPIALAEHDVKERDDKLAVLSLLLNEPIETSKQLTRDQAEYVLNRIKTLGRAGTFPDTVARARADWKSYQGPAAAS